MRMALKERLIDAKDDEIKGAREYHSLSRALRRDGYKAYAKSVEAMAKAEERHRDRLKKILREIARRRE